MNSLQTLIVDVESALPHILTQIPSKRNSTLETSCGHKQQAEESSHKRDRIKLT